MTRTRKPSPSKDQQALLRAMADAGRLSIARFVGELAEGLQVTPFASEAIQDNVAAIQKAVLGSYNLAMYRRELNPQFFSSPRGLPESFEDYRKRIDWSERLLATKLNDVEGISKVEFKLIQEFYSIHCMRLKSPEWVRSIEHNHQRGAEINL